MCYINTKGLLKMNNMIKSISVRNFSDKGIPKDLLKEKYIMIN